MADARLDVALAERGLARSRTHAARLIADGVVSVDGRAATRASMRVADDAMVEIAARDHYVSRAAHKLIAALDAFHVDVAGRLAMDVGSSTGGFSQVLLERGAERVIALDVGHDQLAPELASEPRLSPFEGVNARYLTAQMLASLTGSDERPTLVVADLSFISLRQVIPALVATAAAGAQFVLLVKPQFEVGRSSIREGVVHDAGLRADAVAGVLWAAHDAGLKTCGVISSPIVGSNGNHEYLVLLDAAHGTNPTEWLQQITAMVGR
ncbi:TlyA family RNA methyltransferase [Microbacterium sp. STN6]|uniref:TlyA family RNA methyltransferase n=1 Tax=Microbacterium sp. STN6 TaxID=2995588 RepID=UPI002260D11C|nr:TlyA family RNA methyltransferase [Microbacterium sp. STN6]MCX7521349.1 TlyA family RNA methyltransferase [Microbacterium sp. STN6]